MERFYPGAVIRSRRLLRNWSQDGLCSGICTASYLSKIEQGKTEASPEILKLLFERLEMPWFDDNETVSAAKELAEQCYEAIFSCDEGQIDKLRCEFASFSHRMANSPCAMDYAILEAYFSEPQKAADESLERFFDNRQLALQRILQDNAEDAMKLCPCAYTLLSVGMANYYSGSNYAFALEALHNAYDLAAKEGRVHIMLTARLFMGNCYCNQLDMENMNLQYQIAGRLAKALNRLDYLNIMKYNTASTSISAGQYDKAYVYFAALESPNIMDLHKLAICCEKLGRFDEALSALDRADFLLETTDTEDSLLTEQMLFLVRYRIEHRDYLNYECYGKTLLEVFEKCRDKLPIGYAAFHLPWVLEWYTASRQYRAAYELTQSFPLKV